MSIIYVLLPLSLLLAIGFLLAYAWSIRTNQFEDLETPAYRAIIDEEKTNLNGGKTRE